MPTTILPLSINFLEKIGVACMSDEDYEKLKSFLFIDGTDEPRSVLLGTIIKDMDDGSFNLIGLSLVKEAAYNPQLKLKNNSMKIAPRK